MPLPSTSFFSPTAPLCSPSQQQQQRMPGVKRRLKNCGCILHPLIASSSISSWWCATTIAPLRGVVVHCFSTGSWHQHSAFSGGGGGGGSNDRIQRGFPDIIGKVKASIVPWKAKSHDEYTDNDDNDNGELDYEEQDDDDFVLFEEELTSASPEEKLLKSKQQGKQPTTNDSFTTRQQQQGGQQWSPGSLMSPPASTEDSSIDMYTLSAEQAMPLEYIQRGHNVFITGVAGTGKSLVLKKALQYLSQTHKKAHGYVAVAPTGSTAIALEGQTIHSFAGIGIPKLATDFRKSKSTTNIAKRWKQLQTLVIDEVSMVSGEFFDQLSRVVSDIRNDPRPFGGIQLVVCGDFLQLSPIAPRNQEVEQMIIALQEKHPGDLSREEARNMLFLNRGFCFQSMAWKEANFKTIELHEVYRQRNREFVEVLQQIRTGNVTPYAVNFLRENCQRPLPPNDFGIRPTILHSKNVDVARENQVDLMRLPGDLVVYPAEDAVTIEKGVGQWAKKPLENAAFFSTCIAESELQLKIGAQVMLVKNVSRDSRLVNGSRGTVVGFRSVRKSPKDPTMQLLTGVSKYPVVQFVNGLQQVVLPQNFQSRMVGLGVCTRVAIPLRLAWAITAHKAQGLTLDYVIADVGQVFAEAQLYVALSRASDEKGLELRNFSQNRVRANPLALQFHEDSLRQFPFWWENPDGGTMPKSMMLPVTSQTTVRKRSTKPRNAEAMRLNGRSQPRVETGANDSLYQLARVKHVESSSSREAISLQQKTVAELKDMLRDRGLKVSGRKEDLIFRLLSS